MRRVDVEVVKGSEPRVEVLGVGRCVVLVLPVVAAVEMAVVVLASSSESMQRHVRQVGVACLYTGSAPGRQKQARLHSGSRMLLVVEVVLRVEAEVDKSPPGNGAKVASLVASSPSSSPSVDEAVLAVDAAVGSMLLCMSELEDVSSSALVDTSLP